MSVQSFITIEKKSKDLAEKFAEFRLMKRLEKINFFRMIESIKIDHSRYFTDEFELAMA